MLTNPPQWLTTLETVTFVVAILAFSYNRIVNWNKFNIRTTKLENSFEQYQKDQELLIKTFQETFAHYLKTCEICRSEVRIHHEDVNGRHVTADLREKINNMALDIKEIRGILLDRQVS